MKRPWTIEEDKVLTETILHYVGMGIAVAEACEVVGKRIQRTAEACNFRWYGFLFEEHKEAVRKLRDAIIIKRRRRKPKMEPPHIPGPQLERDLQRLIHQKTLEMRDEIQRRYESMWVIEIRQPGFGWADGPKVETKQAGMEAMEKLLAENYEAENMRLIYVGASIETKKILQVHEHDEPVMM